ncbi:MAG: T9SS type A sorting domain-containing protein [Ferruginibacter sp.]
MRTFYVGLHFSRLSVSSIKHIAIVLFFVFQLLCLSFNSKAQLAVTTNGGSGLAASYTSLEAAITALNAATISTPVIITCAAGNEIVPSGGLRITAEGSLLAPIVIQGAGSSASILRAKNPSSSPGSFTDAIIKILGADWVTIQGFGIYENAANTNLADVSNNMTEWGVAVLYANTSNGAQHITIQDNIIDLNRSYKNSFGIYSNSTHSATNAFDANPAIGANSGNHHLKVYGNAITDVNVGIVVVGPPLPADANTGLEIGGISETQKNIISNYGTFAPFLSYSNVATTVAGIFLRNVKGYSVVNNAIESSNGELSNGSLRGIFVQSSTNPGWVDNDVNTISDNTLSLRSGSALASIEGIYVQDGTASTGATINITQNNFTQATHTVSSGSTVTLIGAPIVNAGAININGNKFTNLAINTTGLINFFSTNASLQTGTVFNLNNNSIVGNFTKTTGGGFVSVLSQNGSSVNGSFVNIMNNDISNIALTGTVGFIGIESPNGVNATNGPQKNISGNKLSNISTSVGGAFTIMSVSNAGSGSLVDNNEFSNISNPGIIFNTLTIGASNQEITVSRNRFFGISCNAVGTFRLITSAAPQVNIVKNKLYDIQNTAGGVWAVEITAGTAVKIANNLISDIRCATGFNTVNDLVRGLSLTSVTANSTLDVNHNSIYLNNATSTTAQLNTACIFHTASNTATTASLQLRNNILVNTTTGNAGTRVALRRSSAFLNNYSAVSNNNDMYATAIYNDAGGFTDFSMTTFKQRVSPRDNASIGEMPPFLSLSGSSSLFLHIDPLMPTGVESGGIIVPGTLDDYDSEARFGAFNYTGTGTATDIGADEFNGFPGGACQGSPASSIINALSSVLCAGTGTDLSLSTNYTAFGISYQWYAGTNSGGPYNISLGNAATQATGNLSVTTYYICVISCSVSGLSFTTTEKVITVSPLVNAGSLSGAGYLCIGSTALLNTNGDAGGVWNSDNSGVATVNPVTGLVTAIAPGFANIIYTISSGCGSPVSSSALITVASGAAPVITGPVNVCSLIGTGIPVVYTAISAGATSYNWVVPPANVTILSGQGTSTLTVLFQNGFAAQPNKQLRVTANSACGGSAQTIYYLMAQTASTPGPITGPVSACSFIGAANASYSIAAVPGTRNYAWTVPSGAIITNGQGTTNISVSFNNNYATGAITVTCLNECGSSAARSLTVTRNNPSMPGLISGPTNACQFITPAGPANYSVVAMPGVSAYNWTVPAGATGFSGQLSNMVSFSYPAGFTSGSISVTATNGCGTSMPRVLNIGTLQPATPGVIDVIQLQSCPNRIYSYTIASLPSNAQSVQWQIPPGAVILSGQGTTSINVSYPATVVNGSIAVRSVNNCGMSVARFTNVKLQACPLPERPIDNFSKNVIGLNESMDVKIFPNPSYTDFTLQVITASKEKIIVRILDLQGRFLKEITVLPYQSVNLGATLKAGSYLAEVKQGKTVKTTRVIKF